jgi:hypothetical protein
MADRPKFQIIDPTAIPADRQFKIVDPTIEQGGIGDSIGKAITSIPGAQAVISTLSPVLDVLARPSYGSARFADSLADSSKSVLDALSDAITETFAIDPSQRLKLSYSDVIRRRLPDFARDNPKATAILGFIGDVALDPTTYLGAGLIKDGIQVGSRVVTNTTKKVLEQGLESASKKVFLGPKGTLELIEKLPSAITKANEAEEFLKNASRFKNAEEVKKATIALGEKYNIEKELANSGYFDAVRTKQDEIEAFLNKLSGDKSNAITAETIAKKETLADLKRIGDSRLPDELFTNEVRQRIEQRITELTQIRPELANQLFEPKALYLKAGLPFGKQKDVIRIMGIEPLSNRIKAISSYIESSGRVGSAVVGTAKAVTKTLGETFNRDYGLPQEYIQFRNELENNLGYLSDSMIRTTRKLFKDVDATGRERIGSTMHWIDDQTRLLEASKGSRLTDNEAAKVTQDGMQRFKLDDKSIAIVSQLQQDYKEAGLLEMRAGLLKNNLMNYSPRGYEIIENPEDMSLITRGKYGSAIPQPYLASSKQRKFLTKEEAEAAGLVPELDAAILYAHRMLSSKRALSIKQFKDSVTELFGAYEPRSTIAHTGILPTAVLETNIPKRIVDDMKMIGEAVYPSGLNDTLKGWIRGFDKLQSWFKRSATTFRPSFAAKQLVSNTIQAALVSGAKAFKALDPRVAADAAILIGRAGKPLETIPSFLTNFISKYFTGNEGLDAILANRMVASKIIGESALADYAKDFKLRTALGQEFNGTELVQLAREHGIIRGFDTTGEAFSQKLTREITKDENSYKNVVGELGKVWNHAAMVEDYGRMMLFLNGMRMGHTADGASKLVNKALFDYQRGLSSIEKNIIRRVVPFYSFQRFAIPFVLKNTLSRPGNFGTMEKMMKTFEKLLISGEDLNPAEANIFNEKGNNYLLEQPRLLSGFDGSGKATINVLNNLTPFDVVNMFTYDDQGNVDYRRTAERTILGALTPFIKVPLSAAINKDFFTGKTIEQASQLGDLHGSIGKIIPQFAKDLMSWEDRTNLVTGKTTTYINPFISYYMMQFIPALRDVVNPLKDVQSEGYIMGPLTASMRILGEEISPIKQKDIDLKEMGQYSMIRKDKQIREAEQAAGASKIQGSEANFEKALNDLQNYIRLLSENSKARQALQVRGLGIGQQPEEVAPSPQGEQTFK